MSSDVQLLGRVAYQGFAAAWPAMEESVGEFAVRMNTMPKVSCPPRSPSLPGRTRR